MSSKQSMIKENINPNKIKKCRSKLEKLLDKNRLTSSTNSTSAVTHVTLDPSFPGKYSFDKTARKKLNKLIKEANKYNINLGIAEKPKEYNPIKVDIDLEIPKDSHKPGDRLYDNDFIMKKDHIRVTECTSILSYYAYPTEQTVIIIMNNIFKRM